MKRIVIFGMGGAAKDSYAHLKYNNIVFCADESSQSEFLGRPVIFVKEITPKDVLHIAIGDSKKRCDIVNRFIDMNFVHYVHPSSIILDNIGLGAGCFISAGCILTTDISIGDHAQLNIGSSISHDCKIGNFFTTGPGARVCGNCTIGNQVYLGANSTIKQKIEICDNVCVGMGACVVKDISEPGVYAGVPATLISPNWPTNL